MKNFLILTIVITYLSSCSRPLQFSSQYFVSANAHSILDSYRDLVSKTNTTNKVFGTTENPDGNGTSCYSAMPAKGYVAGTRGYITFTSWFWYDTDPNFSRAFHTAWFNDQADGERLLHPESLPKPIVNPFQPTNIANHVFEVILIPTEAFQLGLFLETTFNDSAESDIPKFRNKMLKIVDIQAIDDVYMERDGGFMSRKFSTSYVDIKSSVGLICDVKLKNGNTLPCYILNNYDTTTLVWKVKK